MRTPKLLKEKHMIASFLIVDISRVIRQTVDQQMRKVGLTRAQWFILHYVYHYEGITPQLLTDMVDMTKSSIAKQLVTLEKMDWIYKTPHETDGRSFRVFITESMKPTIVKINKMAETRLSPLLDRFDKNQVLSFLNTLKNLDQNLELDLQAGDAQKKSDILAQFIGSNKPAY